MLQRTQAYVCGGRRGPGLRGWREAESRLMWVAGGGVPAYVGGVSLLLPAALLRRLVPVCPEAEVMSGLP